MERDNVAWDRWDEVDRLFDAALDKPATARDAFLVEFCGHDTAILEAVRRLLRAEADSAGMFESPGIAKTRAALRELSEETGSGQQVDSS